MIKIRSLFLYEVIKIIFLITSTIILNLIAIIIPKRLSGIEIFSTSVFAIYLQSITDIIFDLKYNIYGYFSKGFDFQSLLFIGIYVPVNIVFLNYFPYKNTLKMKVLYIL